MQVLVGEALLSLTTRPLALCVVIKLTVFLCLFCFSFSSYAVPNTWWEIGSFGDSSILLADSQGEGERSVADAFRLCAVAIGLLGRLLVVRIDGLLGRLIKRVFSVQIQLSLGLMV